MCSPVTWTERTLHWPCRCLGRVHPSVRMLLRVRCEYRATTRCKKARKDRPHEDTLHTPDAGVWWHESSWGLWGRASTDAMPCHSWVPSSYFLVEPTLILIGCILICFDFCYLRMVGSACIFLWRLPSLLFGGYAEEFHWLTKCFICACCAEIILISNFGVFLFALDLLTNCLSFWEYTQDIRQTDISLNLRLLSMY